MGESQGGDGGVAPPSGEGGPKEGEVGQYVIVIFSVPIFLMGWQTFRLLHPTLKKMSDYAPCYNIREQFHYFSSYRKPIIKYCREKRAR